MFAPGAGANEYQRLMWLRRVLPEVQVKVSSLADDLPLHTWLTLLEQQGVNGLHRAVLQKEEKNDDVVVKLLVEGEGLREVMTTDGTFFASTSYFSSG